jgi:hypothetical protein
MNVKGRESFKEQSAGLVSAGLWVQSQVLQTKRKKEIIPQLKPLI